MTDGGKDYFGLRQVFTIRAANNSVSPEIKPQLSRFFLPITLLALAALPGAPAVASSQTKARKPNVILIVVDDMGYADAGFNGCRDIPTPNLDALARRGVRFTDGYVSSSICSPSRAGFLTGRYQTRFGHERNPPPRLEPHIGLPVDQTTIAQVMKQFGYATGGVGKWHMGRMEHFHPNRRGFDEWFGFLGGGHRFMDWQVGANEYLLPILRNREPVAVDEYLTDAFSREAVAFVERHQKVPFFLYLAYNAPHVPLQAPEKYLERVAGVADPKRRTYAAMMTAVDDGVGHLTQKLRQLNLERDTLIFFLSDNGGPLAVSSNGSSNRPLRDGKGKLYEGGIRVPFVASWVGTLPQGVDYGEPVISLDILPTAAAAAGEKLPGKLSLDGVNLLPQLLGKSKRAPHEMLFWRMGGGGAYAVRRGRYKLIRQGSEAKAELFDLKRDVGETADLATRQPKIAEQLQAAYDKWNALNVEPVFPGLEATRKE